ncbi:MAG: TraU family protein [Gallionellaceae bacterium]|nr:TraU family protein [Gallionellaceae bacterium]
MKHGHVARFAAALALVAMTAIPGAASANCTGRFPNLVTDICWRCVLPLSVGSAHIANIGGQTDIDNPGNPVCMCDGIPPKIGLTLGFWEPAQLAEVPRDPFCFPTLGGLTLDTGSQPGRHSRNTKTPENYTSTAFYQTHHYTFPALYVLGVLNDDPCLVQHSIDIGFITEYDPTWSDPNLSSWINPESLLFANPVALAACAGDCVASTTSKPVSSLYWCAGCQGSIHPMQGFVPHHTGGVTTSLLLAERLQAKMHKLNVAWQYHGSGALCGPRINPIMDRQAYKTQMVYPIPNTAKVNGKCCQNFGESSVVWGAGKEVPLRGDFAYLLFRKRNCCMFMY